MPGARCAGPLAITTNSSPPTRATTSLRAQMRRQPLRHRDQQLVADVVAELVVDRLEAVEVEHVERQHAVRGAVRQRRAERWR